MVLIACEERDPAQADPNQEGRHRFGGGPFLFRNEKPGTIRRLWQVSVHSYPRDSHRCTQIRMFRFCASGALQAPAAMLTVTAIHSANAKAAAEPFHLYRYPLPRQRSHGLGIDPQG